MSKQTLFKLYFEGESSGQTAQIGVISVDADHRLDVVQAEIGCDKAMDELVDLINERPALTVSSPSGLLEGKRRFARKGDAHFPELLKEFCAQEYDIQLAAISGA